MAKLNTNSNAYTIIYASVLVIIVAFLLAFVASALKPTQDANVALDKKKQILASLNLRDQATPEETFATVITEGDENSDLLKASVDGQEKLVIRLKGAGLWGGIGGYISINKDGKTVYGSYFNHESETAGLGARIAEQWFQDSFQNKNIFDTEGNVILGVYKKGKAPASLSADSYVDAVTGATLTSNGVNDMIYKCLTENKGAIDTFKGAADCQPAECTTDNCCQGDCKEDCKDCCKDDCCNNCADCCKDNCADNCNNCCKDTADCCKAESQCCEETPCTNNKK